MSRAARLAIAMSVVLFLAATAGVACDETVDDRTSLTATTGGGMTTGDGTTAGGGATIRLPAPQLNGTVSLEEAIQGRRSIREYSDEPLTLAELGQLLWAAQGVTSDRGGRAAPSAGGTYPLEVYAATAMVTGLQPGVYHYLSQEHALELVTATDIRGRLMEASLYQACVGDGALDIIIAAVYERTTERYGERGVRYVHLEAGHAAQNLCLQAVALGLGAVTVGAFSDEQVQSAAGLPAGEQPLYVIPVGRPAAN